MTEFKKTEQLCNISDPLDWTGEKTALMVEACREMALFHAGHSPVIRSLYDRYQFNPELIHNERDLETIPPIGVTAMKLNLLTSMPHESASLKLTSSGTRGTKTQVWFDPDSLNRVQAMLKNLWKQEGLITEEPTNYLMFIYDPEEAGDLGIAYSIKNQQRFAPVAESFYAIKKDSTGNWKFMKEMLVEKMLDFIREGKPVRISGIPSFIFDFLRDIEKSGSVKLPKNSFILTGGGWKAAEDRKVPRDFFRKTASRLLGIPEKNIRDGYGMAEHSSPYIECEQHRFHIPVYNRILARDPVTMKVIPPGDIGLLELITPFNAMMPTLALLTTDLGSVHVDQCPCGRNSPTFTLAGRSGLVKHKGCAIQASETVERST